jgi:glycosyltransferase involved in cell wall biosynthesis
MLADFPRDVPLRARRPAQVSGRVVPPDDPVRLAAACTALLADGRLRRELGTAARTRARTLFRLGAMLDRYREAAGLRSLPELSIP